MIVSRISPSGNRSNLQFFTSYYAPKLPNSGMLPKHTLRTVVVLHVEFAFVARYANLASSARRCIHRGDEQRRFGAANGHIC